MQRRKVLWLFILETTLLGLLGTIVGASGAAALAGLLNAAAITLPESVQIFLSQEQLHFLLAPRPIVGDVILLAVVTTLASVVPARRAATLKPISAMHHIG
jgi:ABC-type lipoprotein release transport system permease subunit